MRSRAAITLHVGSRVPMVRYPESGRRRPSTTRLRLPTREPDRASPSSASAGRVTTSCATRNDVFDQYVATSALVDKIPGEPLLRRAERTPEHGGRPGPPAAFEYGVRRIVTSSSVFFQEQRSSRVTTQRAVRPSVVALDRLRRARRRRRVARRRPGDRAPDLRSTRPSIPSLRAIGMSSDRRCSSVALGRAAARRRSSAPCSPSRSRSPCRRSTPIGVVRGLELRPSGVHVDGARARASGSSPRSCSSSPSPMWPAWRASPRRRSLAPVPATVGVRRGRRGSPSALARSRCTRARGLRVCGWRSSPAGAAPRCPSARPSWASPSGSPRCWRPSGSARASTHFVETPRLYGQDWDLTVKRRPRDRRDAGRRRPRAPTRTSPASRSGVRAGHRRRRRRRGRRTAARSGGDVYVTIARRSPAAHRRRGAARVDDPRPHRAFRRRPRDRVGVGDRARRHADRRPRRVPALRRVSAVRPHRPRASGAAFTVHGLRQLLPEGDASELRAVRARALQARGRLGRPRRRRCAARRPSATSRRPTAS